jgi:hypothetical protein
MEKIGVTVFHTHGVIITHAECTSKENVLELSLFHAESSR